MTLSPGTDRHGNSILSRLCNNIHALNFHWLLNTKTFCYDNMKFCYISTRVSSFDQDDERKRLKYHNECK